MQAKPSSKLDTLEAGEQQTTGLGTVPTQDAVEMTKLRSKLRKYQISRKKDQLELQHLKEALQHAHSQLQVRRGIAPA